MSSARSAEIGSRTTSLDFLARAGRDHSRGCRYPRCPAPHPLKRVLLHHAHITRADRHRAFCSSHRSDDIRVSQPRPAATIRRAGPATPRRLEGSRIPRNRGGPPALARARRSAFRSLRRVGTYDSHAEVAACLAFAKLGPADVAEKA